MQLQRVFVKVLQKISLSAKDILVDTSTGEEQKAWNLYGAKTQFQTEEVLLSGGATVGTYSSTTEVFSSGDFDKDGNYDLAMLHDSATEFD